MIDPQDPYQAPRADLDASVRVTPSTTPITMPTSVKATLMIIIVTTIIVGYGAIVQGQTPLVQLGILGLVVWGLFRRKALAWQWVRLGSVLAFIATAGVWASHLLSRQPSADTAAFVVGKLVSLLMALLVLLPAFLLGTKAARAYFNVVCPSCGSPRVKAGDFLYRDKRCKACPSNWR